MFPFAPIQRLRLLWWFLRQHLLGHCRYPRFNARMQHLSRCHESALLLWYS